MEPRVLFEAVLTTARERGAKIESGRRVTGVRLEAGRCTGVLAEEEKISAHHVVIAAGCFSAEIFPRESRMARYAPTHRCAVK